MFSGFLNSDAWWEGYRAYQDDQPLHSNPYLEAESEKEYNDWAEGWYEAAWDD